MSEGRERRRGRGWGRKLSTLTTIPTSFGIMLTICLLFFLLIFPPIRAAFLLYPLSLTSSHGIPHGRHWGPPTSDTRARGLLSLPTRWVERVESGGGWAVESVSSELSITYHLIYLFLYLLTGLYNYYPLSIYLLLVTATCNCLLLVTATCNCLPDFSVFQCFSRCITSVAACVMGLTKPILYF